MTGCTSHAVWFSKREHGNHIYKTIAEWIYFQTYHCTGKLETKDIRDYFPYPREDIQRFLHHNPAPFC